MVDLNQLIPALIVVLVTLVCGTGILKASGRKSAQRQREALMQSGDIPECGLVDDSASFGAWVQALFIFLVGSVIATSLLFHINPLLVALALLH